MSGTEQGLELRVFQCKRCRYKTGVKAKIREHLKKEHKKDIGRFGHKSIKTVVDTSDERTPLREHIDVIGKHSAYAPKRSRGIKKVRASGSSFRGKRMGQKDELADWLKKRREKRKSQPILLLQDGLVSLFG